MHTYMQMYLCVYVQVEISYSEKVEYKNLSGYLKVLNEMFCEVH